MNCYYKTTECVAPGHPDKVADIIADSVLDANLAVDPYAKVACEVMVKDDIVVLGGEITVHSDVIKPDLNAIVKQAVKKLGYVHPHLKFCAPNLKILNLISEQSAQISQAVVNDGSDANVGAGDQGIMWGYATNETPNMMPLGMYLARGIMNAMRPLQWDVLGADCKTQVTIQYNSLTKKPIRVSHVVVSCMHLETCSVEQARATMKNRYKDFINNLPVNLSNLFVSTELVLNHAGEWTFGGPAADTGVTGRKIVVDAYGADCEVGGGAFSGKDGTKVDRSGAYAARFIAKNIISAGFAEKCKVQLGYVIGNKEPVSFNIDFLGTGLNPNLNEQEVEKRVKSLMPLTLGTFIDRFNLRAPMFAETARNGHFGISHYPWEQLSLWP